MPIPSTPAPNTGAIMTRLGQQFPAIARQDILPFRQKGVYYSETYPRGESYSPFRSRNAVGVSPLGQALPPDDLKQLMGGEALHIVGGVNLRTGKPNDPGFHGLKQSFIQSMTPEQVITAQSSYSRRNEGAQLREQDTRSYDDWLQQSHADGYLRAGLFPMQQGQDPGWVNSLSPEQHGILGQMREHLTK